MSFPFNVREEQVGSLDPLALTELLLILLSIEVDLAHMSRRHIAGSMNISAPDGGIDCSIEWAPRGGNSLAPLPEWLPKILNGFQVKAGRLAPAGWAKDILEKNSGSKKAKRVKSEVSRILLQGGSYIGFSGESLNEQQIQRREVAIRKQLIAVKFPKAAKAAIKIMGAAEIARWVNSHVSAIAFVHSRTGSANLANVRTWKEWENETDTSMPFGDDAKRATIRESLQKILAKPQVCARLVGFSGVGKSRFAMELFREDADLDHLFYSRVAYISSGGNLSDPDGLFNSFVRGGVFGLIVVDDCPLELHNKLEPIVTGKLSKLSLLTIDHDPSSQPRNGHFYNLLPLAYSALRTILLAAAPKLGGRQVDIITEWAEGFPEMARLLISAVLEGVEVWELGDDELVSKLTAPRKKPLSSRAKECLHGLSALSRLPTWEGSTHLELFAAMVCHTRKQLTSDALAVLEARKLVDGRREHLLMVTPFPLAIRLAAKWWDLHHARAQRLLEDPGCSELWPLLAERMLHLCRHDRVRAVVTKLVMSHNPNSREIWLTQRNSDLATCFVEIDPRGMEQLINARVEDLRRSTISDNTLGALPFHVRRLARSRTFFRTSALRLLDFAASGNVASTDGFCRLFYVVGSGTSVPALERFGVLEEALRREDDRASELVVEALSCALKWDTGLRENLDSWRLSPPHDWVPKTWAEVHEYWQRCLNLMLGLLDNSRLYSLVQSKIEACLRDLIHHGAIDIADHEIRRHRGRIHGVWVGLRNQLGSLMRVHMYSDSRSRLDSLRALLAPTDFSQTVYEIVTVGTSDLSQPSTNGDFSSLNGEQAFRLAERCVTDPGTLMAVLDSVLNGRQQAAYEFGYGVASGSSGISALLDHCFDRLLELPDPNTTFLEGMLRVSRYSDEADALLRRVRHTSRLVSRLPWLAQAAGPTPYRVELLSDAISKGDIAVSESNSFVIMIFLLRCEESAILVFFEILTATSGPVSILKVLYGFHVNNRDLAPFLGFYRSLVLTTEFVVDVLGEEQHWVETAAGLFRRALHSAEALADSLIGRVVSQLSAGWGQRDSEERVGSEFLSVIFECNRGVAWSYLSKVVEAGASDVWRGMIGAVAGVRLGEVPLFDLYFDEICQSSVGSEARGLVLAERCAVGNETEWSPTALFLLENFNDSENVLGRISSARSCRAWIGSDRPLVRNDLRAYQGLLLHKSAAVRRWAEKNVTCCENELSRAPDEDPEGSLY